ncbi:ribonuclease P protein component [Minwuia thermotolerans]|uniref:ribonuclease P protein component n=1 Tax=Minwuia thermotolerans TaxID=2056226 RepID=UPI0013FD1BF3|nr:ribonuclease P protein component [Minwuia thermotolerans]
MTIGRLKKRADFLRLSRSRVRTAAKGLVLQAAPMPAAPTPLDERGRPDMRVGFTASKKVGNAVRRNRAKRRLRALAADVLRQRAEPGHDYVLIARAATVERDYATLADDLRFSLKRIGLLRQGADA